MKRAHVLVVSGAVAIGALLLSGCAGGSSSGSGGAGGGGLGLVKDGTLTICANLESPPNIYAEADGTPVGIEVDIAKAMAKQMQLEPRFSELAFSGLIPALQARQCDTIISSLYIKPEREEIASFVPYLLSGLGILVAKNNPAGITGYDESLCGAKAIAITGASGATILEQKSEECTTAGKPAIQLTLTDKTSDALQQVIAGQAEVYVDTAEGAGYYAKRSNGDLLAVGQPIGEIKIGAASLKDNTALHDALAAAFAQLQSDGTYKGILDEWGFDALDIANAS